jgi:hypothetical protein
VLNTMILLDPRGEGVFEILDRSTHQPSALDTLDQDLFSTRNQQAVSREAARECSPGRKPWVESQQSSKPQRGARVAGSPTPPPRTVLAHLRSSVSWAIRVRAIIVAAVLILVREFEIGFG